MALSIIQAYVLYVAIFTFRLQKGSDIESFWECLVKIDGLGQVYLWISNFIVYYTITVSYNVHFSCLRV